MKLVSETPVVLNFQAPTFEDYIEDHHLSYKPTPEELTLHASEWAKSQGHDEKSAESFGEFYAQLNDGQPWSACMPKRRVLKTEYPRYLEEQTLKNLHPSRRLIGLVP